jgi:hypothetical protein
MFTFKSVINSLFEQRKNPTQARVLFLGDSNTHDSPLNWSGILTRKVGFGNTKIIQRNGATTDWMKRELASDLAVGNKYDYIFIWGGVNDIYSSGTRAGKNKAVQNLKDMIMMLRRAKTPEGKTPKIVVINMACDRLRDESVRYPNPEKFGAEFYRDVMALSYAQVIPTRQVLRQGKASCDALSPQDLAQQRRELCQDKLCHFNPSANNVIANYIQRYVFGL